MQTKGLTDEFGQKMVQIKKICNLREPWRKINLNKETWEVSKIRLYYHTGEVYANSYSHECNLKNETLVKRLIDSEKKSLDIYVTTYESRVVVD